MIITFSGVDCAGKSTQIELLRQYLISQGKSCTVFWYRPGYSDEFQKLKDILRHTVKLIINRGRIQPKSPETSSEKSNSSEKQNSSGKIPQKIMAPLWLTTALLDTLIQWTAKLRYLERTHDVVICDRYIGDALLDLRFKYPEISWPEFVLRRISVLFPKPDLSLLMWLPFDVVLRRAEEKNEPFPDSEETRRKRYAAYEEMRGQSDFTIIDATPDIETTRNSIISALSQTVPGATRIPCCTECTSESPESGRGE